MKKVLITGGKGFFGTRFREAYHHQFEILSTDVDELNILEKEKVQDALNLFQPDYVVHTAAIALHRHLPLVQDFINAVLENGEPAIDGEIQAGSWKTD